MQSAKRASGQCCPWCGTLFRPRRTGGSAQRFCRTACKTAFWSAARQWVWKAMEAGLLSPLALGQISGLADPGATRE